jgi:hemerythrin-like domain-containing protein
MKRHEALIPLSREHHAALILVQLLKRNAPAYRDLPATPADKAAYALEMYTSILQAHFKQEEIILADVKKYDPAIEKLTEEILEEHRQLSAAFLSLRAATDLVQALDALGLALGEHIRKEERVLFPLIQEHCPEEVLKTFVYS